MTTEERLAKLERKCRTLMIAGFGFVGILIAAYVERDRLLPEVKDTVTARRFVLVDDKGKVRGGLTVNVDGATLTLDGGKGEAEVTLTANDEGVTLNLVGRESGLSFVDEEGRRALMLGQYEAGPNLVMSDRNGNPGILLGVGNESKSQSRRLTLFNPDGESYVDLRVEDMGAQLDLYDGKGKRTWSAP